MTREEQITQNERNWKEAKSYAEKGGIINLSALIGGYEQILVDDIQNNAERECYSDNWRVPQQIGSNPTSR